MAYSLRAGSDRVDYLTAAEALTKAEYLAKTTDADLFIYDRFGDPISQAELAQAVADEAADGIPPID
jgi:hypothetical protein